MTDQPTEPESPITLLAQAAIQMHELYRAYVDAGFTQDQAMHLVIAIMQANTGGGK